MTWRMTLLLTCAVVVLVALPACAAKQWDTGNAIEGELEGKWIEIAITVDPDNPVQDTMDCQNPEDTDHSIDPEQSEGQEDTDSDSIANWGSTKCWWWCESGQVTQNSWTTTWTSPSAGGYYGLECSIEDLPKSIPQSESGCRDDARHYAGTAGQGGMQGAQAGGNLPPDAMAVEVTFGILFDGVEVRGYRGAGPERLRFDIEGYYGHPLWCTTVKPYVEEWGPSQQWTVDGWYKKIEIVGVVDPVPSEQEFEWHQVVLGIVQTDGNYRLNPRDGQPMDSYARAHPDSPRSTKVFNAVPDGTGRIYRIDAPGSGWMVPFSSTLGHDTQFHTWVTYKGDSCGSCNWSRYLRVHVDSNASTGWDTTANY